MKMRKGFTLVELLIVIVIIGILAAAMLLSSGSATASAEASNIVNNLRSLKSASVMFYADSMDHVSANSGGLGGANIDNLKDYTDNPDKFKSGEGYLFAATGNKWYVGVILDGADAIKMSSKPVDVLNKLEGKVKSLALFGTTGNTAPVAGATPGIPAGSKVVWMAAR